MGTDNKEQTLFTGVEGGAAVPLFLIDNVDYSSQLVSASDHGNFDCSSFSVTVTVDPDSEFAGHWAMLRRLLALEPLPRKLSRKRFVKWLMALGVPRDYAAAAAAAGAKDCGSYAAAWADLVNHYGTEAGRGE